MEEVEASHDDSTITRMMGGSFMQHVSRRAIGHSVFGIGVDEDNKYSLSYGIVKLHTSEGISHGSMVVVSFDEMKEHLRTQNLPKLLAFLEQPNGCLELLQDFIHDDVGETLLTHGVGVTPMAEDANLLQASFEKNSHLPAEGIEIRKSLDGVAVSVFLNSVENKEEMRSVVNQLKKAGQCTRSQRDSCMRSGYSEAGASPNNATLWFDIPRGISKERAIHYGKRPKAAKRKKTEIDLHAQVGHDEKRIKIATKEDIQTEMNVLWKFLQQTTCVKK